MSGGGSMGSKNVGGRLFPVVFALVLTGVTGPAFGAAAQIPEAFRNLQYFPEDIPRDSLIGFMRGFSFALGVRCQYCHVGGDGISFEGVEFDRDDDPDKRKARYMLRMVDELNDVMLAELPDRSEPPVRMECKTCHRGRPKPLLLTQEMRLALDEGGVDAAVARYRELLENFPDRGAYDFGEWEVNVLGERLAAVGRVDEAIAIYALNAERFPGSASIAFSLGQLHEEKGDLDGAIRHYERTLELVPNHRGARGRLEALRGG